MVHPRTHDGPGDIIIAMGLGPGATVLMSPVEGSLPGVSCQGAARKQEAFSVDMEPGDIYLISGEARWEWRHGVSIDEAALRDPSVAISKDSSRSTIVWRYIDVDAHPSVMG